MRGTRLCAGFETYIAPSTNDGAKRISNPDLALTWGIPPYVVYGVKYIGLVSLAPVSGQLLLADNFVYNESSTGWPEKGARDTRPIYLTPYKI